MIRVYDLPSERIRVDATTVTSFGEITPEGLLQRGHSKGSSTGFGSI